ncbi:MAG: hypothetical protein K2J93_03210 [Anaeroplasmataceae bacterium]|nr:hypothetical protein [Anaeroplasmataceae bacterium]
MKEMIIILASIIILTAIILFLCNFFGLLSFYHPMKKAKENQIRIACVGDSITYGCMIKNRSKNNYPKILNSFLGQKYCVNNFGYTNRTAIKSADYPYVKEKLYTKSLEFNPHIVFFLLGSNDSKEKNWDKEKFIKDYKDIIDSYVNLVTSPKIYILLAPPAFQVGKKVLYQLRGDVIEKEINTAIKEITKEKKLEAIDLYEVFKNKQELFADGVHPNAKGSKLLAQTIYTVLKNDGYN